MDIAYDRLIMGHASLNGCERHDGVWMIGRMCKWLYKKFQGTETKGVVMMILEDWQLLIRTHKHQDCTSISLMDVIVKLWCTTVYAQNWVEAALTSTTQRKLLTMHVSKVTKVIGKKFCRTYLGLWRKLQETYQQHQGSF